MMHHILNRTVYDEIVFSHLKDSCVCRKDSQYETSFSRMWWDAQLLFEID